MPAGPTAAHSRLLSLKEARELSVRTSPLPTRRVSTECQLKIASPDKVKAGHCLNQDKRKRNALPQQPVGVGRAGAFAADLGALNGRIVVHIGAGAGAQARAGAAQGRGSARSTADACDELMRTRQSTR